MVAHLFCVAGRREWNAGARLWACLVICLLGLDGLFSLLTVDQGERVRARVFDRGWGAVCVRARAPVGGVVWFGGVSKRSWTESESIVAVVGHHVAWCMAYLSESRIRWLIMLSLFSTVDVHLIIVVEPTCQYLKLKESRELRAWFGFWTVHVGCSRSLGIRSRCYVSGGNEGGKVIIQTGLLLPLSARL